MSMRNVGAAALVLLAALAAGCAAPGRDAGGEAAEWRLVYQNSVDGRPLVGSVDELIDALKRGSPIRVSWGGTEGEAGSGETWIEFAEPVFTTVIDDSAVVVQFPLSFIQTSYSDVGETFLQMDPPTGWRALMATDGTYHQFHYDLRTREVLRVMYAHTQAAWFARAPAGNGDSARGDAPVPDDASAPDFTPAGAFRLDSVVTP